MSYWVYMLRCRDGSLYTGSTTDVERRCALHNAGKGAKYTRSRLPVVLVWSCYAEDKIMAQKLECAVKKLSKKQKELLVQDRQLTERLCAEVWEVQHDRKQNL